MWGPLIAGIAGLGASAINAFGPEGKKMKMPAWQKRTILNNIKYERWLNNNRIRLVTEDAKRAGIHPLAALGASGMGATAPQMVGTLEETGGQGNWGDAVAGGLMAAGNTAADLYQQDADMEEADRLERERKSERDDARFQDILDRQAQIGRDDLNAKVANKNLQLLDAQINEIRSRTQLMNARASAVGAAPPQRVLTDAFGDQWKPENTGAQEFSDQYGDLMGEVYGITNWVRDTFNR